MPIPKSTTKAEQEEELRRLGLHGDDGDDGDELDSKRLNARKPKSFADPDFTANVYAKFNNPPKSKTLADGE